MVTLRCTRKLLARFPKSDATGEPRSTTRLGDWYANVLNVGRLRLVLCVNEPSRLSVLLPAKELVRSPGHFAQATREVLLSIGTPEDAVVEEIDHMAEVWIAATRSRSVLGSMNDLAFMAQMHLRSSPSRDLLPLERDDRLLFAVDPLADHRESRLRCRGTEGHGHHSLVALRRRSAKHRERLKFPESRQDPLTGF